MPREKQDVSVIFNELRKFPEFEEFYNNEWVPRNISVDLYINPSCPHHALFSPDDDGKPFIELQSMSIEQSDAKNMAFLVAHEMYHAIRYNDGLPLKFGIMEEIINENGFKKEEIIDLAKRIGSMVDDPIIDSALQSKYGFNPAKYYIEVKIPHTSKSIRSGNRDAPNDLIILKQALLYAQFALQFDFITDEKALRMWNGLKNTYKRQRPKVKILGDKIYSTAKETGYETLEKQRVFFDAIANMCTIKGIKIKEILKCK